MLRHHVPRAGAIVANSLSVARDARAALGSAAPVEHAYNAVDLTEFSPSGPVADLDVLAGLPPPPAGTIRAGLVATFARWKGHETFLRALRDMSAPVRGYIVGGSVYDTAGSQHTVDELRALAASLGVEHRVAFTGFVEHPAGVMRALDVVVHASTDPEPFGLVIAEGLACGRPVVVSAGGGAAELVEDGRDAVTFVPGDAPALARALERLAKNESLRARLGSAGRSTAIRRFDPDTYARAFLDVYQRVAPRPRTAVT
jgi:glycosyltransferase involved in cell wall biosynthesis